MSVPAATKPGVPHASVADRRAQRKAFPPGAGRSTVSWKCVPGLLAGAAVLACGTRESGPLSPGQALQTFRIAEGFRIELFAAEPHVVDPVEMVFDESGGVYVAELLDNPDDPPEGGAPLSRIKHLEDTDGDGRIDTHTVFADRLLAVEGIAPWKGGLIATAAPDILYLKDLDGDRKADVREVLYTGFALANVERRLSNPRFGMDNWFYVVNNSYPGEVVSPQRPDDPPVSVRSREFRFHALRGLAETSTGGAQFGQTYNQWGHWFISHNTVHLRHTVIPPGYLDRNPFLPVESTAQDISDHGRPAAAVFPISKPQQWRIDRTRARQARYDQTQPGRVERLEGFFTASSGATVYLGDAFPEEFAGRVFVGEGAGNLVHCDVVAPAGPTYTAARWPAASDFLASTDPWFRPVNFSNAPDGNLYVVDYYRQYLEHPMSIPDPVKRRLAMDFRAGDTMGRIYRIVPDGPQVRGAPAVDLAAARAEELVALIEHSNGWHRRTAHRLLVERQDVSVVPQLQAVAQESPRPNARLHALWILEGLDSLDAATVDGALTDESPVVREHAIRLAETYLPQLEPKILAATEDESPRVALQAALSAGGLARSGRVIEAVAKVLVRYPEDPWFRLAALSARPEFAAPVLDQLVTGSGFFDSSSDGKRALLRDFARTIAAGRRPTELDRMSGWLDTELRKVEWKVSVLRGMADGLDMRKGSRLTGTGTSRMLELLLSDRSADVREAAAAIARHFDLGSRLQQALADSADDGVPVPRRLLAVRVLQGGHYEQVAGILKAVLSAAGDPDLRTAAAASLASFADPDVSRALLAPWSTYAPSTRDAVSELLIRRRDLALELASALADGRVKEPEIAAVTRIRLANHPDEEIRGRLSGLLRTRASGRDEAVQDHLGVIDLVGEPDRGKIAFERECANCHLRRGSRGRIGPDLSGVSNRSREMLLTSILDPSRSIEDRYRNYLVETSGGHFHDGLLVAETAALVTLRGEAEDVSVMKDDIVDMRVSEVSLMPEGLEDALTDQELADVIAYLRAGL